MLCLQACTGYRFLNKSNPFAQYGINSICLPNFYNYSSLVGVGPYFEREIHMELSRYQGLLIKDCKDKVDGVLIGIVTSSDNLADTILTETEGNVRFLDNAGLSGRKDFNIATVSKVVLSVEFILIKHPRPFDQKLFRLGELKEKPTSEILLKQKIDVDKSFNREIFTGSESVINNTQNRGIVNKKVIEMAHDMRRSFRDLVLYAF